VTAEQRQRLVQAIALGLGLGLGLTLIHEGLVWTDGQVYWMAAERLRDGEPLYPSPGDPEVLFYKYAPWFAWAWVPLTFLPEPLVAAAWTAFMLAAWVVPLPATLRLGWQGRAIVALAAPAMLVAALGGNIQPAVVAGMWAWLERRPGPVVLGITASLQVFPVLFVVVYAARRQWRPAALGVALTAVLWLPALAYGITDYPGIVGGVLSLLMYSFILYAAVVVLALVWTWRLRSFSAGSILVLVATSARFIPYHLGYLLCARPRPRIDHGAMEADPLP
jgi:hypothetical protein